MQPETLRDAMQEWGIYFNRKVPDDLIDIYWQHVAKFSDAAMRDVRTEVIQRGGNFFPKVNALIPLLQRAEYQRGGSLQRPYCPRCSIGGRPTGLIPLDQNGITMNYRCSCTDGTGWWQDVQRYDDQPGTRPTDTRGGPLKSGNEAARSALGAVKEVFKGQEVEDSEDDGDELPF